MASERVISSATTLDLKQFPGKDTRFPTTSSESVFTFGNFRIEKDILVNFIDNTGSTLSYGPYSTIDNMDSENFDVLRIINTKENELNLPPEDATSYAYFGSFYTKVANAINNIVDNFPYAFLAGDAITGTTISNYSADRVKDICTFRIPLSSITNQANIIYVSGRTAQSEAQIDLYNDTEKFAIQLSGDSQNPTTATTFQNTIHKINTYSYVAGDYMSFEIKGILLPEENETDTEFSYPIYIRPSRQRFGEYNRTLPNLEDQLLNDGTFLVPNAETETFERQQYVWPRNKDGFAPDSFGADFQNYATTILQAARSIDERKTDIMVRTMLPENYTDLDSDQQVYRKLTTVYAEEFDKIKQYIDGLAYAHSINYDGSESVPNKFIVRLANLLGAKLPNAFSGEDLLDYLAGEVDDTGASFQEYNLQLWRRMLTNIIWLYKKKGTRDAITFIFKLIGAPDCLFNLEEFIYTVQKSVDDTGYSPNIAADGYPDIDNIQHGLAGNVHFQAGGIGRGDGQEFIDAFEPQFQPEREVDNLKIQTGGTRHIVNTKELCADLRPSRAIECDVKDWYELGYGWWGWGSTDIVFSGLSVPFEWQVESVDTVVPSNMSAMTIHQWLNYIYANNVNPRNRKTSGWQDDHTRPYINLKKIYMSYMLWENDNESNRLTFRKLEKFLNLLERNYQELLPFFIPSTSILACYGTVYGNTEFNRHSFVYRPGINDGSEFQVKLPPVYEPVINGVNFSVTLPEIPVPTLNAVSISASVPDVPAEDVNVSQMNAAVATTLEPVINGANSSAEVYEQVVMTKECSFSKFNGTIMDFPT